MTEVLEKLELVHWTDPVLLTPAEKFNGTIDEARVLENQLIEAMDRLSGLGLSACQVGLPLQAFALKVEPRQCMFNPRVIDRTEDGDVQDEACLSFRGISAPVWRPKAIRVRFQASDGQMHTEKYSGMTARVILHEMEHLQGRVFFDHMGKMALQLAIRRAAKRGFEYRAGKLYQIIQQSRQNA